MCTEVLEGTWPLAPPCGHSHQWRLAQWWSCFLSEARASHRLPSRCCIWMCAQTTACSSSWRWRPRHGRTSKPPACCCRRTSRLCRTVRRPGLGGRLCGQNCTRGLAQLVEAAKGPASSMGVKAAGPMSALLPAQDVTHPTAPRPIPHPCSHDCQDEQAPGLGQAGAWPQRWGQGAWQGARAWRRQA